MAILHIPVFHGISPRNAPRKLNPSQSQTALNCELFSNELRPLRNVTEAGNPTKTGTIQSIYLLGSTWLHWTEDVDVARSPLYLQNELRVHYSGAKNPKSTDDTLAFGAGTDYPTDFYRLGLPRPDTAATVGTTGGTGNNIDRSYIYTFVTAWGEEGPPSPVGTATGPDDAVSWDITDLDATPPNQWTEADVLSISFSGQTVTVSLNANANHFLDTTEYVIISGATTGTGTLYTDIIGTWQVTRLNSTTFTFVLPTTTSGTYSSGIIIDREAPLQTIGMTKRLYRTIGGNYRFVADGITGTTFTDDIADVDLGELLPFGLTERDWWKAPNGNLSGLTSFPTGVLVGFFGNTLAFSEPNVPSAWPEKYQYTFNNDIVAIGVVGNSVIVATNGFPSIVTGNEPESMFQSQLEVFQACVSKRSLVTLVNGAVYASPDGLVYVPSVGLPNIITQSLMKKKDWDKFNPSSMISDQFDDRYYGFYTNGGDDSDETGAIIIDPEEPGATFTTLSAKAEGLHSDLETDSLYFIDSGNIKKFDAGGGFLVYTWLSKLFTTASPICYKAAKVKLTFGSGAASPQSVTDAIAAVTAALVQTALNTSFGADNNYNSGAFAGFSTGQYSVAGGPYANGIGDIGAATLATMRVYAHFDNGTGSVERHLVHTEQLTGDSKPFRLPGGYLADQWEVEFNCNDATIHEVVLGTSMREIARV